MSETATTGPIFDAALHADAVAPAMGLTISAEQRPGVLQYLALAAGMAATVRRAPRDDAAAELAPVFRPGESRAETA